MQNSNHCRMQDFLAKFGTYSRQGERKDSTMRVGSALGPVLTDCSKGSKKNCTERGAVYATWQGGCIW